jgi:hypothetical protein
MRSSTRRLTVLRIGEEVFSSVRVVTEGRVCLR